MLKIMKILAVLLSIVLFSGCSSKTVIVKNYVSSTAVSTTLDEAIYSIANQLKLDTTIDFEIDAGTIAVTSFVDLNKLSKTTQFGRILGESMISELFKRGFNVSDFRGQGALSVNKNGEFYITRDVKKLTMTVPNTYVLVGTYAKIEDKTLLNIRILDNRSGKLVASAREIYTRDYCDLSEQCAQEETNRIIRIISDNAPKDTCQTPICAKSTKLSLNK